MNLKVESLMYFALISCTFLIFSICSLSHVSVKVRLTSQLHCHHQTNKSNSSKRLLFPGKVCFTEDVFVVDQIKCIL